MSVNQIQTSGVSFGSEAVNYKFSNRQIGCSFSFVCAPNLLVSFGIGHFVLHDRCVSCLLLCPKTINVGWFSMLHDRCVPKLLVSVGSLCSMISVLAVCVSQLLVSVVPKLRASLSGTFLQTLPDLVTSLM